MSGTVTPRALTVVVVLNRPRVVDVPVDDGVGVPGVGEGGVGLEVGDGVGTGVGARVGNSLGEAEEKALEELLGCVLKAKLGEILSTTPGMWLGRGTVCLGSTNYIFSYFHFLCLIWHAIKRYG